MTDPDITKPPRPYNWTPVLTAVTVGGAAAFAFGLGVSSGIRIALERNVPIGHVLAMGFIYAGLGVGVIAMLLRILSLLRKPES